MTNQETQAFQYHNHNKQNNNCNTQNSNWFKAVAGELFYLIGVAIQSFIAYRLYQHNKFWRDVTM